MYDSFEYFTRKEWIYETNKVHDFEKMMTPEERQIFYLDPKTFTWDEAVHLYSYGIEKYMNKQDVMSPVENSVMLLHKNKFRYFDDARRAFLEFDIISVDPAQIRKDTLLSKFVSNHLSSEMLKLSNSSDPNALQLKQQQMIDLAD